MGLRVERGSLIRRWGGTVSPHKLLKRGLVPQASVFKEMSLEKGALFTAQASDFTSRAVGVL